ncbi:outer membrane beta-barrel protein [Luteimonas suaedae]|uniref:outer membrane beta-barrel protein n=1 Tax=Luteimonas suaedae TaxID=2605430 RepID=UPI0011EE7E5B|nr:outer membrane beta-barrel protein [Luteimonas suaedae]
MKNTLMLACTLALATLSGTAFAQDAAGGFIRGEIGRSDIDLDVDGFGSASEEDTSAVFGGGYWFNEYVAVEGHIGTLYNTHVDDDVELDLITFGVGVALKKSFGGAHTGFFVGGRAGVARLTAQVREDDFDVIDDESDIKPYFGVSAGYDFSQRFGLSLNWDRRQADFDGVEVDVDTIAVGGEFRF